MEGSRWRAEGVELLSQVSVDVLHAPVVGHMNVMLLIGDGGDDVCGSSFEF